MGCFWGVNLTTLRNKQFRLNQNQKECQSHYQNALEKLEDSQTKPKQFKELIFPSKKNPEFSIVKGQKLALILFADNFWLVMKLYHEVFFTDNGIDFDLSDSEIFKYIDEIGDKICEAKFRLSQHSFFCLTENCANLGKTDSVAQRKTSFFYMQELC